METINLQAPAKINTYLRVVGKRADGYHDLEMVMVPISLFDDITIEKTSGSIEFMMDGLKDDGMLDHKNLCWKAASLLKEKGGVKSGAKIHLRKRIPLAAGLGGGSSDAATVLKGLNQLWGLNWSVEGLAKLGGSLGADIPFFCHNRPALVSGIGDKVEPLSFFPSLFILLINPGIAISTREVYEKVDDYISPKHGFNEGQEGVLQLTADFSDARFRRIFKDLEDVCEFLRNDLEGVVLRSYSGIVGIKNFLREHGAVGALMSGSGSTVFGIFRNREDVNRAAGLVQDKNWKYFPVDYNSAIHSREGRVGYAGDGG